MKTRFTQIIAVHLLLIKDGKILLARRCNTGYEDGNFSVPAGHVERDETCIEAMIREAQEEIAIKVSQKELQLAHVMHRKSSGEHRIDFFFACNNWAEKPHINEPDKCDVLEWFELTDLPKNIIPYVEQAIAKVAKEINYSELGFEKFGR